MAKAEQVYTIPLRKEWRKASRNKRAEKAIRATKEFLQKHMKAEKVSIGPKLNQKIWENGIQNPPAKVKVNTIKYEDDTVKAELVGHPIEKEKTTEETETEETEEDLDEEELQEIREELEEEMEEDESETDDETESEEESENETEETNEDESEDETEEDEETSEEEANEIDYEELVQQNISDIKEKAQNQDINYNKLLEAEQNNKDRTTLIDWIKEQQ